VSGACWRECLQTTADAREHVFKSGSDGTEELMSSFKAIVGIFIIEVQYYLVLREQTGRFVSPAVSAA
jgi:hypothetical protein